MRRITFQGLKFMGGYAVKSATVNRPQDKHTLRFWYIDGAEPRLYSAFEEDEHRFTVAVYHQLDEITAMAILHHFRYGVAEK